MAFLAPFVASIVAFVVAYISIRRPDSIRSWMRGESIGVAPEGLREAAIEAAPTVFAVFGILFGVLSLIVCLGELFS
jgi:hypothetical protein